MVDFGTKKPMKFFNFHEFCGLRLKRSLYPDVYPAFLEYFTYTPAYHHIKYSKQQRAYSARRYDLENCAVGPPKKVEVFGGKHIVNSVQYLRKEIYRQRVFTNSGKEAGPVSLPPVLYIDHINKCR